MNTKFFTFVWLILALLLSSCGAETEKSESPNTPSATERLYEEVMNLHNAEMGKMGELKALKRQLNEAKGQLDSMSNPSLYAEIVAGISAIDSGTFAMNSWMRNFSEPDSAWAEAQKLEHLNLQLTSMENTRDLMGSAMDKAALILQNTDVNALISK